MFACSRSTTSSPLCSESSCHHALDSSVNILRFGITTGQHCAPVTAEYGQTICAAGNISRPLSGTRPTFRGRWYADVWIAAGLAFYAALVAHTQLPRDETYGAGTHGEPAHHDGHATFESTTVA